LAVFGYFYTIKPKFELENLRIKSQQFIQENENLSKQIINKEKNLTEINNLIKQLKFDSTKRNKNIEELTILNTKSLNTYKFTQWEIFLSQLNFITSSTNKKSNDKKIKNTEQDNIVLQENAPYLIIMQYFNNLKYSDKFYLLDKSLFEEFKLTILKETHKEKTNLKYLVNNEELYALRKKYNNQINKLLVEYDDYNNNQSKGSIEKIFSIQDKVYNIHKQYDSYVKQRYATVNHIINALFQKISLSYKVKLNINKNSIKPVKIENRKLEYNAMWTMSM
jgi:hypothetical protein